MTDPFKQGGKLWNVTVEGREMSSHGPCKISFSARYHHDNPYRVNRVSGEILSFSPKIDLHEEVIDHLMFRRLREEEKLRDVGLHDVGVAMMLRPDSLSFGIPWPEYEAKVCAKATFHRNKGPNTLMKLSMYFDIMNFPVGADGPGMVSAASEQVLKILERGGLEVPPESKWSVVIFNKKTERVKVIIVNAYDEIGAMREAISREDISNYLLVHATNDGNHMTFDPNIKIIATKVD